MDTLYIFLIALFCVPVMGHAQQRGSRNDGLPLIKSQIRALTDSVGSNAKVKQPGGRVFDTAPMPNLYQRDYAVAMPNAYRGDNCVPMPNAYQARPDSFIIRVDSAEKGVPDSTLMKELDKLKKKLHSQRMGESPSLPF